MSSIVALAVMTFRESMRSKIFFIALAFGVLLMASGALLPAVDSGDRVQLAARIGSSGIAFFTLLLAILLPITSIREEFEDRRWMLTQGCRHTTVLTLGDARKAGACRSLSG